RPGGAAAVGGDLAQAVPAAHGGDDLPQFQLQAAVGVGALRGRVGTSGAGGRLARAGAAGGREGEAAVPADQLNEKQEEIGFMATVSLEQRVAALEAEVARLKAKLNAAEVPATPWWEKIAGSFANDPIYEEAMRLGREW